MAGSSNGDWDTVHQSNFESAAFSNDRWVGKARSLYECAKKLEPEIQRVWENLREKARDKRTKLVVDHYQGVYFMLLSFAVENLLKAAAVAKNGLQYRNEFRRNKKFPKELQSHDLVKLARDVGLTLMENEEDMLRRLTRSAVWYGRYPAPLEYSDMSGMATFRDGRQYNVTWLGEKDIEALNALLVGLPARLGLDERYWRP